MYLMLSNQLKPQVVRIISPIARGFLKIGLTPDAMTVLGTILVVFTSIKFIADGQLLLGFILVSLSTLSDLFDGTMARLSNKGASKWGSFLDSTLDRISDSAILISLSYYLISDSDRLAIVLLGAIPLTFLIPYIRAKAESLSIECSGGIAERTERLIIVLAAIGLAGLGVPYSLAIGIWLLALLSLITVLQRIVIVRHALK